MAGLLTLGAPGVRFAPPEPLRAITGVQRDVAAFAGVAPRGPATEPAGALEDDTDVRRYLEGPRRWTVPVAVESWAEYRRLYSGFEGPGRLPYAVAAFFAQGGRRAYVLRIVHDDGDPLAGRASGRLGDLVTGDGDALTLLARDEGTWGDRVRGRLVFRTGPLAVRDRAADELTVDLREWVPVGSLLRLRLPDGTRPMVFVADSFERPAAGKRVRVLRLAAPQAAPPETAEVVTADVELVDHDPSFARRERLTDLGLAADHPRWIARVLAAESSLVWPDASWAAGEVDALDPALPAVHLTGPGGEGDHLAGGEDRWAQIVPDDFFDPRWVPGDEAPRDGVQSLAEVDDVALLLAPDLYEPSPLADVRDVSDPPTLAGATFEPCPPPPAPPGPVSAPDELTGLALPPNEPGNLETIAALQQRLVDFAEAMRDVVALIDVPPGLTVRDVLTWRGLFDSPAAATYHPWLDVARPDDARDALVSVPPSAFAAGIVAAHELVLGVQHGPANVLAVGAVRTSQVVDAAQHDRLHPLGVNVFMPERDGIRLTAARTLSRRVVLRQLNVVRLLQVVRLSLEHEMAWAVFEPNGEVLWADVRRMVGTFLRRLYDAGAFVGPTPSQSYFVRCDRTTMTQNDLDNGRLVCLVGLAPAEPVEWIVLRVTRDGEVSVRVEVARG